jgi:two-component system chemotaxis response regulator CheB
MLSGAGRLPADTASNGIPIKPGRIVVAAPDRHLMLESDRIAITHGPRENRHRPCIDVLFRSAAVNFGTRVIGLVLSGRLDDGSAGLWSIKRCGGDAIVQDPKDAEYPDMPRNAMDAVQVDYVDAADDIAARLIELAGRPVTASAEAAPVQTVHEVRMASELNSGMKEIDQIGKRTPLTCPECGGATWEFAETGTPHYRCHVGHAYSLQSLASEQLVRTEAALWAAVRSLEENERVSLRLAEDAARRGRPQSEKFHADVAAASQKHADVLRDMLAAATPSRRASATESSKPQRRR